MITIKSKMTKYSLLFVLVFFNDSISSSDFGDAFKDYILGADQQSSMAVQNTVANLPSESVSSHCIACHDGNKVSGVTLKHADAPIKFTGHGSVNHPVGMKYENYARHDPAMFVAPERLDRRIMLEAGEVTCVSCHALNDGLIDETEKYIKTNALSAEEIFPGNCSADKNNLTTGSNITTLCLSCHAM